MSRCVISKNNIYIINTWKAYTADLNVTSFDTPTHNIFEWIELNLTPNDIWNIHWAGNIVVLHTRCTTIVIIPALCKAGGTF